MRKAYLLVYSDKNITREQITKFMNESDVIITWRYDMPNSYYFISEESAKDVSMALRESLFEFRHIIVEIEDNYWGWLPNDTWYLIKNKRLKKKVMT